MKEKLEKLKELCNLFQSNIKEYKSAKNDEANTRTDFIEKFFEVLGWDVRNNQGYAEGYREVVREDKVIIEGKPKAPDYSFRIGGVKKFFLEAKKSSINSKEEIEPAFQIRRYGYTAKLPLAILTDFEEFAIYDTRIKPEKTDKASVARVFYCTYEDYVSTKRLTPQFDFIYNTFSKNAILNGSFDKYVAENKNKKGSSEVDKEFLSLIEDWRESLAKNIVLRNKDLDIYSLNNSVQVIIDRIIFLRIAEDRNIEKYGLLREATLSPDLSPKGRGEVYEKLNKIFLKANDKYNSRLFKPEKWISDLDIDDNTFQNIIKYLYYPDCPYEFSVLPIEILGNIYEQFLGKTIRLSPSHQVKIEEKVETGHDPSVRKVGGVYYTPGYIVNYIVQNTVGEKLDINRGLSKQDESNQGVNPLVDLCNHPRLTILDPACGSGIFLVDAYSFILDKYLESYTEKKQLDKCLKNGLIYQVSRNTYRLSIAVKQDILTSHIFGVDIDNQAVEVTKLSLLLKLMEDENSESADRLFNHSDVKLLPDLQNNIKCGNSLIGSDFYSDKNLSLSGKEEMKKVNTFDWEKEFPEVFREGGFDIIIGNPPYVKQETLGEEFKVYAKDHYKNTFAGTADLYVYFIEKSLSLLADNGLYAIIVANKWMRSNYGESLRKFLKTKRIFEIIDFGDLPVFKNATTYPCIIKANNNKPQNIQTVQVKDLNFPSLKDLVKKKAYQVDVKSLDDKGWSLSNQKESALLDKIKKAGIQLGEYVDRKIYRGVLTGYNPAFIIDEKTKNLLIKKDRKSQEIIFPYVSGDETRFYSINWNKRFIIFTKRNINIDSYPAIKEYLSNFKSQLQPKKSAKDKIGRKPGKYKWYEIQDSTEYYSEFCKEKIVYGQFQIKPDFAYSTTPMFFGSNHYMITNDNTKKLKFLLSILNSKIFFWYMERVTGLMQGHTLTIQKSHMEKFSIPKLDLSDKLQKSQHDKIVSLVEQMLSTQKELRLELNKSTEALTSRLLQQKCDLLDKQIDKLVYELYGLTDDEIKIVDGSRA